MEKGRNIIIYRDGVAIAGTRSNESESQADLVQKSSPNTAEWKEYVAGDKSWMMQTNVLVPAVSNIEEMLNIGNTYTLIFGATGQTDSTKHGLTGTAILRQARITATLGNLVQGTFIFQGTGALTSV